jgi:hypothetical protein
MQQHGTQASKPEPMTSARRLQVVSALADGDLDTINKHFDGFAFRAFPGITDWPLSVDTSHSSTRRIW